MAFNPTGVRTDPFKSYNFWITLIDSSSDITTGLTAIQNTFLGGFSECSGLEMSLELESHQEGGNNGTVLQFPTRVTWSNISLKRGMSFSDDLWTWHYSFAEGKGNRRDGLIVLLNDLHLPVKAWKFIRGLPAKWTGPMLEASQSQVAIEELQIAHEGVELTAPGAALAQRTGVSF